MRYFKKPNLYLLTILLCAFLLRLVGLTPNFLQHPNEPGIIEPASRILINTLFNHNPDPLFNHNPDPGMESFPFKYASSVFYMHALIRGTFLSGAYIVHKTTGYTFSVPESKFGNPNFENFLKESGPYFLSDQLLWLHRLPSVIFGTLTVLLVYKIALLLFKNKSIALFSALALAVMPHHVRDSHYAAVDIIQTFFFTLPFFLSCKMWKNTNSRTCTLAGFAAGFATSIKYFPLGLLPLIFFLFLNRNELKKKYLIITFIAFIAGYITSMPYILAHFNEITSYYKLMGSRYAPNQLGMAGSFFDRIAPTYIHAYNLKFFATSGVGFIFSFIGVFGIFYAIKTWRTTAIALLIIPTINLLFISLYLETVYEILMIPVLPFFAIFIGITSWVILRRFNKRRIFAAMLLTPVFLFPFLDSAQASFACTKTITEFEAHDWIAENIPKGAKLAFQPNMRLPSKDFEFIRSEPKENFLLSEVQAAGAEYIALHSGYTDRYPQWLDDNLFISKYIKDNEFTNLVLDEYKNNANLLKAFVRPKMCVNSRIYIYKIPPNVTPAKILFTKFNFADPNSLSGWELGRPREPSGTSVKLTTKGTENAIEYSYTPETFLSNLPFGQMTLHPAFYGTPFRSPFTQIIPNKKYSVSADVKRESEGGLYPDGFIRLDFYKNKKGEPILTRLSPRLKLRNHDWEDITVTTHAPSNAYFATISFQTSIASVPSTYMIKEIKFLSE